MMDDNEDIQQGPSVKGKRGFQKGFGSPNPNGAPKKEDRKGYDPVLKKQSKLRATEKKLMKLTPQAIENIEKSVKGESVDKEVLSTSKWVVTTSAAISKQAMMEELEINGIKDKLAQKEIEDSQAEDDDENGNAIFSMDLPTASTILN
jgi:hypothetical protein